MINMYGLVPCENREAKAQKLVRNLIQLPDASDVETDVRKEEGLFSGPTLSEPERLLSSHWRPPRLPSDLAKSLCLFKCLSCPTGLKAGKKKEVTCI